MCGILRLNEREKQVVADNDDLLKTKDPSIRGGAKFREGSFSYYLGDGVDISVLYIIVTTAVRVNDAGIKITTCSRIKTALKVKIALVIDDMYEEFLLKDAYRFKIHLLGYQQWYQSQGGIDLGFYKGIFTIFVVLYIDPFAVLDAIFGELRSI
ncbi:hypothetical protein Tco_1394394 [Tanacetum coccineum]